MELRFSRNQLLYGFAGVFTLVLVVLGLAQLRTPQISASNIEKFDHQLASNSPVKISFNTLMNRGSVEKAFSIQPAIAGEFSWFLNRMTFTPEQRFTVTETYTVSIKKDAAGILGRKLTQDSTLTFLVVDAPAVSLAVPNNETSVDSKITVMMSRPMVELTTLSAGEGKNFPLEITPKIRGRFKWLGTSAFQYIPEDRLAYSTQYTALIPKDTPSLDGGKMEEEYAFSFRTPRIKLVQNSSSPISASQPFTLAFTQPVDLASLKEHLVVENADGDKVDLALKYHKRTDVTYDDNGKKIESEVEDKTTAEIMPAKNDWGYDNVYSVEMSKGVSGLEGNLSAEDELKDLKIATNTFLTARSPDARPDGAREDADPNGGVILFFDQDVDLNSVKNNFKLEPEVKFSAAFNKKCDPKWEPKESPHEKCAEVDDHRSVKILPDSPFENLTQYAAILKKDARAKNGIAYLKEDITWSFTTADALKILRSDPVAGSQTGSYSRICIFSNNLFESDQLEKQISFAPAQKGKLWLSVYETNMRYLKSGTTPQPDYYGESPCLPRSLNEKYALQISMALDPQTPHTLTIKADAQDSFGQKLGRDYALKFTTESMKDSGTALDIMQDAFYATTTLDQHAYPVFYSQNLRNFDLEICRLEAGRVLEIDTEWKRNTDKNKRYDEVGFLGFAPNPENCSLYKKVAKNVNPVWWTRQYHEINLAKELGANPLPGYYFIRASSPKVYRSEPQYVYDSNLKRSVVTGEKRIPLRPSQLLDLTNLHVAMKSSRDTALFWATDVTTGKPAAGVSIELFQSNGTAVSGTLRTDRDGIAKKELHQLPFSYAVATQGGDAVIVNANWNSGISPWDFRLGYSQLRKYTQGYIYTDRPLYQPTHEVFFKGILRDDEDTRLTLPASRSIEVEIFDSQNKSIYKKQLAVTPQGTFSDSVKLAEEAPLGMYRIRSCLSKATNYCADGLFEQWFYVEEYRKPEYKLETTFSQEEYIDKQQMRALIDAEYFFGAPVANGKVDWSIRAQNYYFDEYREEWFSFTDYETYRKCYFGCPYEDQYLANGEGVTNKDGTLLVVHDINLSSKDSKGKAKQPDSSKIYTVISTVQDKNNQTVSGQKEVIVHRGEFYVGIKNDRYIVSKGEKMPIRVIAVDHKGKPVSGKAITVELFKADWKYVKKKNIDGGFYWENERTEKSVDSFTVRSGNDGKADISFEIPDGGEYFARASGADTRGNIMNATVDFYATSENQVNWKQENNNRMELKLDKPEYEVGETAKVFVQSPYANVKALLTYERGDIMESRIIDIRSNAEVIEVPITENMIPNFYASVLEAKPGTKSDPPDFKLGMANIVVDSKNKILQISIKTDKERYQPRERVNLEIQTTDAAGSPVAADLSIAAVDASLLALKGNPKRDLVGLFYDRRNLGVLTADNLAMLLERINISDVQGSKGGSGKGGDEFGKARGKFEDTAFWRSTVSTDAIGKLATSFTLPDNLTTWNIEVVGATATSLFGSANKTVTTQKAVMVRPVLPRFALFKDELELGAIVHNFTGKMAVFKVSLDAENLDRKDGKEQKVTIPSEGSVKVLWSVHVPDSANGTEAKVTISATGDGADDAVINTFPLYSYATPEVVATSSYTDDVSYTEKVVIPSDTIDLSLGELKITTGATLATYFSDSLKYLISFPYGCTEQIISRLVPNIVISNAAQAQAKFADLPKALALETIKDENGKPVSFESVVSRSLQTLYANQKPDGGFGYFSESRESYPSVTAYAVFGMHQIKKGGYAVDENVQNRAVEYLRDYMRENRDLRDPFTGKLRKKNEVYAADRAYMLFVLSETGRGDVGLSNALYQDRALLTTGGKAYLAMTLYTLTQSSSNKINTLVADLENEARIGARGTYIRNTDAYGFSMMTNTKVTSLTLQALGRINPAHPLIPKILPWLIASRSQGRWATTQDTTSALLALTEYIEKTGELDAQYRATVLLNGDAEAEYGVSSKNVFEKKEITKSLKGLEGENDIVFSKDGSGRLYYDIVFKYFLPVEKIAPRSEGFAVARSYYRVDDAKLKNPVTEAKAGETLRGKLTIVVPEERNLVAVENFLPAGFELVNFNFENVDTRLLDIIERAGPGDGYFYGYSPWTHSEMRDDRLFLFAEKLMPGVYEYDYFVNVTSEGNFHHKPAVVSEMYFPENFGRTAGEWMKVR